MNPECGPAEQGTKTPSEESDTEKFSSRDMVSLKNPSEEIEGVKVKLKVQVSPECGLVELMDECGTEKFGHRAGVSLKNPRGKKDEKLKQ